MLDCGVCGSASRYTCPKCLFKSCSLKCSIAHKSDRNCDGIKPKTKFIALSEFKDEDLVKDYYFLQDVSRYVGLSKRDPLASSGHVLGQFIARKSRGRGGRGGGNTRAVVYDRNFARVDRLRKMCKLRNIYLRVMPNVMLKRKQNRSHYSFKEKCIFWTLMWIFPLAVGSESDEESQKSLGALQNSICENLTVKEALIKFFTIRKSDNLLKSKLEKYHNSIASDPDYSQFEIYMRKVDSCAKTPAYFQIDIDQKLSEILEGLVLIEFPEFIVELKSESSNIYNVIPKESIKIQGYRTGQDEEEDGAFHSDNESMNPSDSLKIDIHRDPEILQYDEMHNIQVEDDIASNASASELEDGEYVDAEESISLDHNPMIV